MRIFKRRAVLVVIIGLALALVTVITASLTGGSASPVANALGTVFSPVQSGISSVADWVGSIYSYMNDYDRIVAENAALKNELARIKQDEREYAQTKEENERFRKLLKLSEKRRDFELESAMVVGRNSSNWSSTLEISRGTAHGIEPGAVAINEEGFLVGIVSEVGLNWAMVTTLIDTDTELGAIVSRTNTSGVAEGDFELMKKGYLKLAYLPRDTEVLNGDVLLTAGTGGVYPKGLVVGTIEQVATETSGISAFAVVDPAVSLVDLKQVFLIKSFVINE